MSELKNAVMFRSKSAGSKQGLAALFSKQSSAAISTDTVLASSTAMSLPGVAQPLVGSEPAGRQRACSLWSMKLSQLRAWCGKKHGNSIKAAKKDNKGQWTKKLKKELISDFKNAAMLRSRIGGSKKGFATLFSKQTSAQPHRSK
jgi:hypothetical protein